MAKCLSFLISSMAPKKTSTILTWKRANGKRYWLSRSRFYRGKSGRWHIAKPLWNHWPCAFSLFMFSSNALRHRFAGCSMLKRADEFWEFKMHGTQFFCEVECTKCFNTARAAFCCLGCTRTRTHPEACPLKKNFSKCRDFERENWFLSYCQSGRPWQGHLRRFKMQRRTPRTRCWRLLEAQVFDSATIVLVFCSCFALLADSCSCGWQTQICLKHTHTQLVLKLKLTKPSGVYWNRVSDDENPVCLGYFWVHLHSILAYRDDFF